MRTSAGIISASAPRPQEDEELDFTKVVLQASFDGLANGATAAPDTSMYAHTLSFADTAAITTAQARFGTSSLAGSQVEVPMDAALFSGFEGEFGIEFFFRHPTNSTSVWSLVSSGDTDGGMSPDFGYDAYSWRITYLGSSAIFQGLSFQWHEDGEGAINHSLNWIPNQLPIDTWYHVYMGRDASNRLRIYLDGDLKTEVVYSDKLHVADGTKPLSINGTAGDGVSVGSFIQYLRIVNGMSLYTGSSFTPPAAPPF